MTTVLRFKIFNREFGLQFNKDFYRTDYVPLTNYYRIRSKKTCYYSLWIYLDIIHFWIDGKKIKFFDSFF